MRTDGLSEQADNYQGHESGFAPPVLGQQTAQRRDEELELLRDCDTGQQREEGCKRAGDAEWHLDYRRQLGGLNGARCDDASDRYACDETERVILVLLAREPQLLLHVIFGFEKELELP